MNPFHFPICAGSKVRFRKGSRWLYGSYHIHNTYPQSDCLDELRVGDKDDGEGNGEAEGVDEDDVAHVGLQRRLCPNNAAAELV